MTEITNEYDALVMALALAISAPDGQEDKIEQLVQWAEGIADNFDMETVERAKAEAAAKAHAVQSNEETGTCH